MLEFRKDIFADERDDSLIEIGQPTRVRTFSATSPALRPITTITVLPICCT